MIGVDSCGEPGKAQHLPGFLFSVMNVSPDDPRPVTVAYGGGVNSTAMLCGMRERGIVPALITFADTKGEHPHTYEHVAAISAITQLWWGVPILTVRKLYQGEHEGLEAECLRRKLLPSIAYGTKACSMKHKVEPQTRALKLWMDECGIKSITRAIGYDAGEGHRAVDRKAEDLKKGRTAYNWFPLIEWQWRREDCVKAITRHNLPVAKKSACFFCPATKRGEVLQMKRTAPDLFDRALAIENNAVSVTPGRGLGGSTLKWSDLLKEDEAQAKLWDWVDEHAPTPVPCGCFDG